MGDDDGEGGGSTQEQNPVHSARRNGKRHGISDGVTWHFDFDAQRAAGPETMVEVDCLKWTVIFSVLLMNMLSLFKDPRSTLLDIEKCAVVQ